MSSDKNNNMIEGVTEGTKINEGLDIKGPKIYGEIRLPGADIKGTIFDIHEAKIGTDIKGPV